MAPIISQLCHEGVMEGRAYHQRKVFAASVQFAQTEGIVSAPETAHAIACAIDEALAAREAGERRVILFNHSGHGLLDLGAYDDYLSGKLEDYAYPAEKVREAMTHVPKV
jgi:tryptophan synthase beta chain